MIKSAKEMFEELDYSNTSLFDEEEIDILTIPKVQGTLLLNLIRKLSYLEKDIKDINCINDIRRRLSNES